MRSYLEGDEDSPYGKELRRSGKAKPTRDKYLLHAEQFTNFCEASGFATRPNEITRDHVTAFLLATVDGGGPTEGTKHPHGPETAATRYRSLRAFFRFLVDFDAIEDTPGGAGPMNGLKPPKVPQGRKPGVPKDDLRKVLKTCDGKDFNSRRDKAILLFFLDTGCRLGEMAGLTLPDIDSTHDTAEVTGKGSRHRIVKFANAETSRAMDRYLLERSFHPWAEKTDALWLGRQGPMTGSGIRQMLQDRCELAGVARYHPHQLRRTWAQMMRAKGANPENTMKLAGWSTPVMYNLYTGDTAAASAIAEAERLDILSDL
jgi:site-specific recombinase XerD